jgi:uncharacterized membrane protein
MAEFLLALLLFLTAHVVPPAPPVRRRLIALLGRRGYLLGYSVLSLLLLTWIIVAARDAPYVTLWTFEPWQPVVPVIAMPLAFWFVTVGLAEPNPLSISLRHSDPAAPLAPIVKIARHPVLWGFLIWALAHLPPNGDLVSLVLFGGLAGLALAAMPVLDRRARARLGKEHWQALAHGTSTIPFLNAISSKARIGFSRRFGFYTAVAIAAYLWFLLQGHQLLIGPDPLSLLSW